MVQPADDAEDSANELRYLRRNSRALGARVSSQRFVLESRTPRSVRTVLSNEHPYRDRIPDKPGSCLSS